MSRGWRIRVPRPQATAHLNLEACDHLEAQLDPMPILDPGEMAALVKAALEKAGWVREGDRLKTRRGEVEITLEPDGRTLKLTTTTTGKVSGRGETKKAAEGKAKAAAKTVQKGLTKEAAKRLVAVETELRAELEPIMQGVYVEALKQKARGMGEVESIDERSDAEGRVEVTIKIKV